MRTGMILGIIGGVIALLIGAVGYGASSTLGAISSGVGNADGASAMQFYSFMSIVLPITGLAGSGLAGKNPKLGITLMGASAAGILWVFGFGVLSLVPVALLSIGAFLIWSDTQQDSPGKK